MPDKKKGWTRVAFGDVVRLCRERSNDPLNDGFERYVGLEHLDPEDLKIRRWGNVADGTTFTSVFRAGQVLFGKRRAYQRKLAVPDFDGVCSGDIYVLEPRNEHLLPELLPFICQTDSFFDHAVGTSAGSLSPRTNWKSLAEYEFALPPLDEQKRISEVLGAIRSSWVNIRKVESSIGLLITSYIDSKMLDTTMACPLGDILLYTEYGCSTYATVNKEGVPILRIPNVLRDKLDLGELKRVQLSKANEEKYLLRAGDILIVRTNGNPEYVGRCLVLPPLSEKMVYASYLIRLVVNPSLARPDYVASVLNSPRIRSQMRGSVRSSAGNYNINSQGIRSAVLPVPELAEQDRLISKVAQLKTLSSGCEKRASALNNLQRLTAGGLFS